MKKLFFSFLFLPIFTTGQQNLQSNTELTISKKSFDGSKEIIRNDKKEFAQLKLPVFSIFGLANLNKESLEGFNAGGKATVVVRPNIFKTNSKTSDLNAIAFYASFNKSATNNDSIVYSKLIFPELGVSSFIGTLQYERYFLNNKGKLHSNSVFVEMGIKSIRADTTAKGEALTFDALNYIIGYKYGFNYIVKNPFEKDKNINLGFYVSPFLSIYNIPDEDVDDYKKILISNGTVIGNADKLENAVYSLGAKTGFHFNGMEFFADVRHVLGKTKVPIRELRGFHANIGFVFNADVINIY